MAGLNLISTKPEPSPDGPPILFDRALLRQRKNRAEHEFLAHDFLFARVADDLLERISAVNRRFPVCLAIGGGGAIGRALNAHPQAAGKIGTLIEADIAPGLARHSHHQSLVFDEEQLPIREGSIDLILNCLTLHWTNDIVGALIQMNYALKPDGLLAGAVLGEQTLCELRQVIKTLEGDEGMPRISPFADTIDMAGLVSRAGLAMPVSDIDPVTARYDNAFHLMKDLRHMGETNALAQRSRTPLTRSFFLKMAETYAHQFGEADGKIPARFDIIHFAGWGPHPDQPKPKRPGSAKTRLASALGVQEFKSGDKAG